MRSSGNENNETRNQGDGGTDEHAIAFYDGRIISAKVIPRFGKGEKMCSIVGYTYTIELDGKSFKGNAKGAQDFITLKEI